jgi:hypothetical protein
MESPGEPLQRSVEYQKADFIFLGAGLMHGSAVDQGPRASQWMSEAFTCVYLHIIILCSKREY